jgi:hypothetical protein
MLERLTFGSWSKSRSTLFRLAMLVPGVEVRVGLINDIENYLDLQGFILLQPSPAAFQHCGQTLPELA